MRHSFYVSVFWLRSHLTWWIPWGCRPLDTAACPHHSPCPHVSRVSTATATIRNCTQVNLRLPYGWKTVIMNFSHFTAGIRNQYLYWYHRILHDDSPPPWTLAMSLASLTLTVTRLRARLDWCLCVIFSEAAHYTGSSLLQSELGCGKGGANEGPRTGQASHPCSMPSQFSMLYSLTQGHCSILSVVYIYIYILGHNCITTLQSLSSVFTLSLKELIYLKKMYLKIYF